MGLRMGIGGGKAHAFASRDRREGCELSGETRGGASLAAEVPPPPVWCQHLAPPLRAPSRTEPDERGLPRAVLVSDIGSGQGADH